MVALKNTRNEVTTKINNLMGKKKTAARKLDRILMFNKASEKF